MSTGQVNNFSESNIEIFDLKESYNNKIKVYANTLINEANNHESGGIYWKKYLNLPNDSIAYSQYYFGYYYGAAGIGQTFLDLYQYFDNNSYLEVAEKVALYLINKSIRPTDIPDSSFWRRADEPSGFYSSYKYGSAGIIKYFLSLYNQTKKVEYLEVAVEGLNGLLAKMFVNNTNNTTYWGYDYGLIPIIDIQYGVAGIAENFLYAYQITKNTSYLETAKKSMNWILSMSNVSYGEGFNLRSIIYTTDITYNNYYTGYHSGVAGVGNVFLQLYEVTKEKKYLIFAEEIAHWLMLMEKKGYWDKFNAMSLMTLIDDDEGSFTGYSAGSSGIAIFFMRLYANNNNLGFLQTVKNIYDHLNSSGIFVDEFIYWRVQTKGSLENITRTDLSTGVAGIGLFYSNFYEYFGNTNSLGILEKILNFYDQIEVNNSYIPTLHTSSSPVFDSSYFEGLTGIIFFMLETVKGLDTNHQYSNIDFSSLPKFYFIPKSSESQVNFYFNFGLSLILIIIITVKRKKTRI